ncbi:hypothetical protein J6G99_08455 [bacterium]|nr:hypothetical protein [bacterium]
MGKTVADIYNLVSVRSHLDFENKKYKIKKRQTLWHACFGDENLLVNDELYDYKVREIVQKLANALDNNSIQEIKSIKFEYGATKDFVKAKKFIEYNCKKVWNVFDDEKISVPTEAMKCLGITNQPDLDFILGNYLKYFEKDESPLIANIITSTLKNQNLNYTLEDIHKYLVKMNKKENCHYNFKTVEYLIKEHNYKKPQLSELGIDEETIKKAFKNLSVANKLKFVIGYIYAN